MNDLAEIDEPRTIAQAEPGNMLPMIQQALAQGIDPDKLSKMLDLHERWTQARAQERFAEALSAFQSECPMIFKRRKTTGSFSFQYASLDDIYKQIQPILAKHSIAISFRPKHEPGEKAGMMSVTIRIRVGSYFEDSGFSCPVPSDLKASEPGKYGAALSYAKRYALCAALNIVVTDEDDDAASVVSTISALQMEEIESLIRETGTNIDRFLAWAEIESLAQMPVAKFGKAIVFLKQKKAGK